MQNLLFTFNVVAPVFLVVALGFVVRISGIIDDGFVSTTSKFTFEIALPIFVFMKLYNIDLAEKFEPGLITFAYVVTIVMFLIIWLFASMRIKRKEDMGVFVQGSFRSNYAIVGLAVTLNMFGEDALARASLLLVFLLPLYNLLSVIVLTRMDESKQENIIVKTAVEVIRNPLIIAVVISIIFSQTGLNPGKAILTGAGYISDLALPVALIGIGASMNIKNIRKASRLAFYSSLLKLVVLPCAALPAAILLGFEEEELGIIFILFACPTAIVSFIMAEAMGGNSRLAGNIVVLTTIASVITMTLGLVSLKELGII